MKLLQHISASICMALALAGCSAEPPPDIGDAQDAFAAHSYKDARNILFSRIDAGDRSAEVKLLLVATMLRLGDGLAADRYIDQLSDGELDPASRAQFKAHSLIIQGKPELALEHIETQIDAEERTAGLYRMIIWASQETGALAEDTTILVDALQAYPGDPHIHALAGRYYQSVGEWDYAEEGVRRALENDPDHYEAQLLAGELAIRRGDLTQALATYKSIAGTYPEYAVPITNVAGLQLDLGKIEEAEATINTGLARHPGFDPLNFQKARLEFAQGQYSQAARTLDQMVVRVQNYTPALILSSRIALELGNRETATVQLIRASRDADFGNEATAILQEAGLR